MSPMHRARSDAGVVSVGGALLVVSLSRYLKAEPEPEPESR